MTFSSSRSSRLSTFSSLNTMETTSLTSATSPPTVTKSNGVVSDKDLTSPQVTKIEKQHQEKQNLSVSLSFIRLMQRWYQILHLLLDYHHVQVELETLNRILAASNNKRSSLRHQFLLKSNYMRVVCESQKTNKICDIRMRGFETRRHLAVKACETERIY